MLSTIGSNVHDDNKKMYRTRPNQQNHQQEEEDLINNRKLVITAQLIIALEHQ